MEVGGFAVGVASLGIQVCKGLLIFYQDWKDCPEDVQEARSSISSLNETFILIEKSMRSPGLELDVVERVKSCLLSCNEGVKKLQKKLEKIRIEAPQGSREKAKASALRLAYPFRKSVVEKLKETVQDLWKHLTLAIQVLHLDLGISTQAGLERIQENIGKLISRDEEEQLEKALSWLSAPDPTINHEAACKKREEGTCLWLLESEVYKDWSSGKTKRIWLHGKAGCCKTVLCSAVIKNTKDRVASDSKCAVAYFYFSFSDTHKQTYENLLASIIAQLSRIPLLPVLEEAKKTQDLSARTLEAIVSHLVRQNSKSIIILDALDEAPEVGDERENVIAGLQRLALVSDNIHWLITSRNEPDIRTFMTDWQACPVAIDEKCVNIDINLYVAREIERNSKLQRLSAAVKREIRGTFEEKADGMFRWAYCQLDEIKRLKLLRPQYITKALKAMPRTLDETYERILASFEEVDDIRMALQWLAFSERPITVAELQEACLINFESKPYVDSESRSAMDSLTDILASLIRVDYSSWGDTVDNSLDNRRDSAIISLAHFSVKEYLMHDRINSSAAARFALQVGVVHHVLAQSCVAYLLEYHGDPARQDGGMVKEVDLSYPLLSYASNYWSVHQRYVETHLSTNTEGNLHLKLLKDDGARFTWLTTEDSWGENSDSLKRMQPLYCATRTGLVKTVSRILDSGSDVDAIGGYPRTALNIACNIGYVDIVDTLLRANADPLAFTDQHDSALENAASCGHDHVVRVILSYATNTQSWAVCLGNSLYAAANRGHEGIVQLLIQNGAEVNYRAARRHVTALGAAARYDFDKTVEIILRAGADVDANCGSAGTPLILACTYNCLKVFKLLLNAGANVNAPEREYRNALRAACSSDNAEMVSLLLAAGANTNFRTNKYGTALNACIYSGSISCMELLVASGADFRLLPPDYIYTPSGACADFLIQRKVKNLNYRVWREALLNTLYVPLTDGNGAPIRADGKWREDVPERCLKFKGREKHRVAIFPLISIRRQRHDLSFGGCHLPS